MLNQQPKDMKAALARIQELEALNAAKDAKLKATERRITLKVSEKGGVSLYGFGRFPITLYGNQWNKLWEMEEQIKSFIETNKGQISFEKKAS